LTMYYIALSYKLHLALGADPRFVRVFGQTA
jgi:hypothetical protein